METKMIKSISSQNIKKALAKMLVITRMVKRFRALWYSLVYPKTAVPYEVSIKISLLQTEFKMIPLIQVSLVNLYKQSAKDRTLFK